jgi:hypothetical protein
MENLLGTGNTKLKKTAKEFGVKIFNFSIPAGNDKKAEKLPAHLRDLVYHFAMLKKACTVLVMLKGHYQKVMRIAKKRISFLELRRNLQRLSQKNKYM